MYAERKGLTVNIGKCATLVFQRRGEAEGQPMLFDGAPIPFVQQFRYLGADGNEVRRPEPCLRPTADPPQVGGGAARGDVPTG
jgi:hypothetical protein